MNWIKIGLIAFGLCLLANLPDMVGQLIQTSEHQFGGVVFAPEDGLSYLAKMGQGQRGSWSFALHSPNPCGCVCLYLLSSPGSFGTLDGPTRMGCLLLGAISEWVRITDGGLATHPASDGCSGGTRIDVCAGG
jgi:hypothetical protein